MSAIGLAKFVHIAPAVIYDDDTGENEGGVQIIYALPSESPEKTAREIVSMNDLQLLYKIHLDQQHSAQKTGMVLTKVSRSAGLAPIQIFLCVYPLESGSLERLLRWLLPAPQRLLGPGREQVD